MSIAKALDRAIMQQELSQNPNLKAGYTVNDTHYDSYIENAVWEQFKTAMEKENPIAFNMYGEGGGKELEERVTRGHIYPPKMASFGSSSRMIYNLMKSVPAFLFEKKLPTTVGGTANLDGFMETAGKCIFVEAKCREPYGKKSGEIGRKYEALYRTLKTVTCHIDFINDDKMRVEFCVNGASIEHFDMKQMISHLLGVATAYLNGTFTQPIDFVYLLYNPTSLKFKSPTDKQEICDIYNLTCHECLATDFKALFYEILCFLQKEESLGVEKDTKSIADNFSFRLCDQYTMSV